MKTPRTHRFDVQLLESLNYISDTTGVGVTTLIETLMRKNMEECAKHDPILKKITRKNPNDYKDDQKAKRGVFSTNAEGKKWYIL